MRRPKRAPTSATTASSLASTSNSGRLSRPPQIPDGGRSSSSTAPLASCIASSVCARTGRSRDGARSRQLVDRLSATRDARVVDGTCGAIWTAARANRCTQIHQALRVRLDLVGRQKAFRALPELTLDLRAAGIALNAAMTRQHTPDVAVENRGALAERECCDRTPQSSGRCRAVARAVRPRAEILRRVRRRSVARSDANCALASNTPAPPSTPSPIRSAPMQARAHQESARQTARSTE